MGNNLFLKLSMFKAIHAFFKSHYHHHYHAVYRHPKKLFIFDLFLLAAALIMLGSSLFFFFWKPGITDQIDIQISLGDTRIQSGENVRVTVTYTNRSKLRLDNATLALRLPDGFVVDRQKISEKTFSNNSIFTLGQIEPGAKGRAEVSGQLWATPKEETHLYATLAYTTSNNNQEAKLSSYLITLPTSILKGELNLSATSTFPGQSVNFMYVLENRGKIDLNEIQLSPNWRDPVIPAEKLKNITLKAGEKTTLQGAIKAPAAGGATQLQLSAAIVANNIVVSQGGGAASLTVLKPDFSITLKPLSTSRFIEPGTTLPVEISWKNNSSFSLTNLRIRVTATEGALNLAKTAGENRLRFEGNSLLIDKTHRTALSNGNPGGTDTFTLNLVLANSFRNIPENSSVLKLTPAILAESPGVKGQIFTSTGNAISLPVATEVTWRTRVRYFTPEGDQLGRGPLPPEVGAPTKYWIFAEAFNTINPVENPRLTITLAPGVTFTGKQSITIGNPATYNAVTNQITWQHNTLPAHSTTGIYFEVSVTPTPNQIGKTLTLVTDSTFSATDQAVEKTFNLSGGRLSNVLENNDRGFRAGAIVQ